MYLILRVGSFVNVDAMSKLRAIQFFSSYNYSMSIMFIIHFIIIPCIL